VTGGLVFPDWLVGATFLWAVAHDRSIIWACDRADKYSGTFRPRKPLPSISQVNRRRKSDRVRVRLILQLVHEQPAGTLVATGPLFLDGKLLVVFARRSHGPCLTCATKPSRPSRRLGIR
jgi:hypothetical protein